MIRILDRTVVLVLLVEAAIVAFVVIAVILGILAGA